MVCLYVSILFIFPQVIVQFQPSSMPDEWGTTQDGQTRPRVVKRGIDDDHDEIPDGEYAQVCGSRIVSLPQWLFVLNDFMGQGGVWFAIGFLPMT